MTGAEHYRLAEAHLVEAAMRNTGSGGERFHLDAAQVHATLALAAASAWPVVDRYKGDSALANEWSDAIGWVLPAEIVDEGRNEMPATGEQL